MNKNNKVSLKRQYSIIFHSPDTVEARYGVWNPVSFTFTDESKTGNLINILGLLDGSLTLSEVAKKAKVQYSEVEKLVDELNNLGILNFDSSDSLDHYLDIIVPTLRTLSETNEKRRPIELIGDRELTDKISDLLTSSLSDVGITILDSDDIAMQTLSGEEMSWITNGIVFQQKMKVFESWRDKFLVFSSKSINPIRTKLLNLICLFHRIPWIHAAIDGPFLFIGPIFIPHRTACYECFETRVYMNLRESASYQHYKRAIVEGEVKYGSAPIEPVITSLLASHTALETLNYCLTNSSFTVGKVMAIYLPTMEITFNEVLRLPGCRSCSPSAERDDKELYFDIRAFTGKRMSS